MAVAYLRVSTDDQRLGPAAQRSVIELWAAREGVTVTSWRLDDGVSGGSSLPRRPALLEALAVIREARAGVLVVAKRDRLARDVVIAAQIETAVRAEGARVISADGTGNGTEPADGFMRTVLDGAAAYERDLIKARTRAALAVKRARGERTGMLPWGYALGKDGKTLIENPHEQACIAEVRRLRAEGLSMRAIARALWPRFKTRRGNPFIVEQINRMLKPLTATVAEVADRHRPQKNAPPTGPGGQPPSATQEPSLPLELQDATLLTQKVEHPVTGQRLVNRRLVRRPDFLRHGAPLDLTWVVGQVRTLAGMGIAPAKIASALVKTGVRRGDGSDVEAADVMRWSGATAGGDVRSAHR